MKRLTCEMCGSNDFIKDEGLWVCQVCGVKYSTEEAKKMMVEGTVEISGQVKIDRSEEYDAAISLAKANADGGSWDLGYAACQRALLISPDSFEAWDLDYHYLLTHGYQSTSSIVNAANNALKNYEGDQGELCNKYISDFIEKNKASAIGGYNTNVGFCSCAGEICEFLSSINSPSEIVCKYLKELKEDYLNIYVTYLTKKYTHIKNYKENNRYPQNETWFKVEELLKKYNMDKDLDQKYFEIFRKIYPPTPPKKSWF